MIVFEVAEEDGDESIANYVSGGAPSEEDVGLVDQKNSLPGLCQVKYTIEAFFSNRDIGAKFAARGTVEGFTNVFGDCF